MLDESLIRVRYVQVVMTPFMIVGGPDYEGMKQSGCPEVMCARMYATVCMCVCVYICVYDLRDPYCMYTYVYDLYDLYVLYVCMHV